MIIFVKPHQFLPVEKNCCKEKNVICLFQRQAVWETWDGRSCLHWALGEFRDRGVLAVILSVGVRYFAPRRTLSIIWRHF